MRDKMVDRWQRGGGVSPSAISQRARRADVFAIAEGRCYYCGQPLQCDAEPPTRDWILVRNRSRMVIDHGHPRVRGGDDTSPNSFPACFACNSAKAALAVDEFRLVRSLRAGTLNFSFHAELERRPRDWLCVHSREFERNIFFASFPGAMKAYGRGKISTR